MGGESVAHLVFQANLDGYNVISVLENDEPIDAWSR
jgi:hypothetical protein